jgi:hypothetical protein
MVNKNSTISNQHFVFSDDHTDDLVLIKSTGEVAKIRNKYYSFISNFCFPDPEKETDNDDRTKGFGFVEMFKEDSDKFYFFSDRKFKTNYLLTNGQIHQEQDLVVGLSNIRNYKLQNFIENGI